MNQKAEILITDDDLSICQILGKILAGENYQVIEAHTGKEALQCFAESEIDLVLLDLQLPDASGIEVATQMIARKPMVPVTLISAYGTISKAVEATKLGIYDFLEKPLERDRILVTVRNALAKGHLQQDLEHYKQDCLSRFKMIGKSSAIQEIYQLIEMVAPTNSPVLIQGENGVGKELVAQAIHAGSPRANKPLVKLNCAAIPDNLLESELFGHTKGAFTGATNSKIGRFQMADDGTLFLDEIGDLSLSAQAKLLRFLDSGEIQRVGSVENIKLEVRILAASNKNLQQMVKDRLFREDLFYRLSVFPIFMPALRERKTDIPLLLGHFIDEYVNTNGVIKPKLTPAATNYLAGQDWPGNIRQLRNFVERLMIMKKSDLIDLDIVRSLLDVKETIPHSANHQTESLHKTCEQFEREYIIQVLQANDWHVAKAAEILCMDRANLYRKMKQLGISLEEKIK